MSSFLLQHCRLELELPSLELELPTSKLKATRCKQDGITARGDRLVMQAYGFNPDNNLLEKLLTLNLELVAKEKRGEASVGPWAKL